MALGDLLGIRPAFATFLNDPRLSKLTFRQMLFIDTETTGLAGAGTFAFLVGVGFFEQDAFVLRQYFLRDHDDEPAMLAMLAELSDTRPGLVSFNGKSFDIPLLDNRFLMNRMGQWLGVLPALPHLDLLPPARRLWRLRLGSCALTSLERSLLGIRRQKADVPGYAIPGMYFQFLQDGDGREMARVFYHNQEDIISMVTLAGRALRLFHESEVGEPLFDLLSVGRWRIKLGDVGEGERLLKLAIAGDLPLDTYQLALKELAYLLKRQERREEAVPLWQQLAVTSYEDVTPHVELAKHFEWQTQELAMAQQWTERALQLAAGFGGNAGISEREALQHRLARLKRKQQLT